MSGNPDIEEGSHYCPGCKKKTEWKGAKVQRCYECSRRFPCGKPTCSHQDCDAHRAVYGTPAPEVLETSEATDPADIFTYMAS